jgi:predicted nucleic acid-binding protein
VFTSRYVPAELATLLLYKLSHRKAVTALTEIRDSETINILPVDPDTFTQTFEQFEQYDDQEISFIDHLGGVLAANHDIHHIFAFDGDFATLGFTRVPVDTGIP